MSVTENKKLLSLSPEVVAKLNKEKNQSALVDTLLFRYYGLDLPEEGGHMKARHEILAHLDYESDDPERDLEEVVTEPLPHGKPLDSVQGPTINLLGRPAVQTADGIEFADNICESCSKPKLAGFCPTCDL